MDVKKTELYVIVKRGWILLTTDVIHCKKCNITFKGVEIGYFAPDEPCCPRCKAGTEDLEVFRRDGKIVTIDNRGKEVYPQ